MTTPPPSAADEAVTRDHYAANRQAIMAAAGSIERHARGIVIPPVSVGMDHTGEHIDARWWARAEVRSGRGIRLLIAEEHPSAVQALEALARKVGHYCRQSRRR